MALKKKYQKLGFVKGWIAQKKQERATARLRKENLKKSNSKSKTKSNPTKPRGTDMAKGKGKGKMKGYARKAKGFMAGPQGKVIMDGAIFVVSLYGSTIVINSIPVVKDWNPWLKGGTQFAIGMLMAMDRRTRKVGIGVIGGSMATVGVPLIRKNFPNVKLHGNNKGLSQAQIAKMQALGVPVNLGHGANYANSGNGMGIPVNLNGNYGDGNGYR